MKASEAPPAGWYPDPEGSSRLRWWEGTDWSDRYRARPPSTYQPASAHLPAARPGDRSLIESLEVENVKRLASVGSGSHIDPDALIAQVRMAARSELERAAQQFGQQARAATRNLTPLITEYTTKITRFLRIVAIVTVAVLVLWFLFQAIAQQSLFDWLGDRIDNLTDESAGSRARLVSVRRGR